MRSSLLSLSHVSLRNTRTAFSLTTRSIFTISRPRHPCLQSTNLHAIRLFSSPKSEINAAKEEKPPKKGLFAKIKDLWKDYGYKGKIKPLRVSCFNHKLTQLRFAAVLCYASLYFLNLGGLCIALETDVLHLHDYGFDAPAILDVVMNSPGISATFVCLFAFGKCWCYFDFFLSSFVLHLSDVQ